MTSPIDLYGHDLLLHLLAPPSPSSFTPYHHLDYYLTVDLLF
jgi:hypothetical protein